MPLLEPYSFTKEFYRALTRYILAEPMRGGRILRELRPERVDYTNARKTIELARSYAEAHSWQAPTPAELRQKLHRQLQEGQLDKSTAKGVHAFIGRCKHANGISQDTLLEELVTEIRVQALKEGLDAAIRAMGDGKIDTAFKKLDEASVVGRDIAVSATDIRIPGDLAGVLTRIQEQGNLDRAVSPSCELDRYMRGGAAPGQLATIMGVVGSGKTTWLCDLTTCNLRAGCARVVHYTLEVSHVDVVTKVTANLLGMTIDEIESGNTPVWELEKRARALLEDRDSAYIVRHVPPKRLTVRDIRQHLRALRVEQNFTPNLVVIDYADLMSSSSGSAKDNSYVEQGDIYTELKTLAIEWQTPIWTATQATRDSVDQVRLFTSSIAESYKKAHIADYVISIGAAEDDIQNGMKRLYIAKNRYGSAGVEIGPFSTDFNRGRFLMLADLDDIAEEIVSNVAD